MEWLNAGHAERDIGEVGRLTAQQGDNAVDRNFDVVRRALFRA
jgi:hypothetical protein